LYSAPFHQNVDRIGQINLRTFDPFVPESRQTVANCKKHRSQRHNLSDKCKHVLAIVDSQEGLLAVKPMTVGEGISSQGGVQQKTEISIKFGDGIPETAKEYIKNWIEQSGMVNKPYSRQYDVHNLKDDNAHEDKPYVVMMAPFEDLSKLQEKQLPQLFASFNENPRTFSKKYKVGNVRIYSVDKTTGEDDAMGFKNYLPLKIVGKEMIGKNLKKSNELIKATGAVQQPTSGVYIDDVLRTPKDKTGMYPAEAAKETGYDLYVSDTEDAIEELKRRAKEMSDLKDGLLKAPDEASKKTFEWKIQKLNEKTKGIHTRIYKNTEFIREHFDKDKAEKILRPLEEKYEKQQFKIDMTERKRKTKENHTKQRKIISDLVNPNKNLAANRGKSGMDPIGRALQVVETGAKSGINIINAVKEQGILNEKRDLDALENEAKDIKREMDRVRKMPGNTRVTTSSGQEIASDGTAAVPEDGKVNIEIPEGYRDKSEILDDLLVATPDQYDEILRGLDPELRQQIEVEFERRKEFKNKTPSNINEQKPEDVVQQPKSNLDNVVPQQVESQAIPPATGPKPLGYSEKSTVDFNTNQKNASMTKSERILKKLVM
jgi:hypothetical protein